MRSYIIHGHEILDGTKDGNGEHGICWNPNVKFISMGWIANPEKVSMTLKQWHKSKYERGKRENGLRESDM